MNGTAQLEACSPILNGEVCDFGPCYDERLIGSFFVDKHQVIPSHDDFAGDGSKGDSKFSFLHLGGDLCDEETCATDPNRQAPDNGLFHNGSPSEIFGARVDQNPLLKIVCRHCSEEEGTARCFPLAPCGRRSPKRFCLRQLSRSQ
jgi:hypothetical protein